MEARCRKGSCRIQKRLVLEDGTLGGVCTATKFLTPTPSGKRTSLWGLRPAPYSPALPGPANRPQGGLLAPSPTGGVVLSSARTCPHWPRRSTSTQCSGHAWDGAALPGTPFPPSGRAGAAQGDGDEKSPCLAWSLLCRFLWVAQSTLSNVLCLGLPLPPRGEQQPLPPPPTPGGGLALRTWVCGKLSARRTARLTVLC